MKHILIVNPAAGKTNALPHIREEVASLAEKYDVTVYETTGKGDATEAVRRMADERKDEAVRFYACGGDGTLNEVVAGAYGKANASVSCYPCGSGNDFVKYYGGAAHFLSLAELFEGEEREVDLITDGERYAINTANFGFDYAVLYTMERARRIPLLGGKRAYYAGIARSLFGNMKNNAEVYADGELLDSKGQFLLCTAACGNYIGGSYMCAPRSDNEDGLLEICYVKSISVFRFLKLMGYYTRGEHLDDPLFKDIIVYRRAKELTVRSYDKGFGYALDGEMVPSNSFTLRVLPRALRFAIPAKAAQYLIEKKETLAQKQENLAAAK